MKVDSDKTSKWLNSLPDDKILDLSNLKDFEDEKIILISIMNFVMESVENIVGKRQNAGCQHFLLYP